MINPLISNSAFLAYQRKFFDKVKSSPYKVTMIVTEKIPGDDALADFVGSSERTSVSYELPCLYEKVVSNTQREAYGLPLDTQGVIYLSPLQLIPILGTFRISRQKVSFIFEGIRHGILMVDYMEQIYNSCIAVKMAIKHLEKGG